MHRLLVETRALYQESPALPLEAARHLKVLRPKDGEEIELFDGCGNLRRYRFAASARALESIPGAAVRALPPPEGSLTLFACVTKGSRWDWTIEKATELGVSRIVPVISDRTIVRIPKAERAAKCARWRRIAEEAARQSDAVWLPEITEAMDFADALPLVKATRCLVGALTNPPPPPIGTAVGESSAHLSVFVGPEGDFTPDELRALLAIATPVSFGPTVLRAETAAIFGVSVLAARRHHGIWQQKGEYK
ncbi:MAG: RsmE family RNA methyltransferase [Kiritimatiellia bacterium]